MSETTEGRPRATHMTAGQTIREMLRRGTSCAVQLEPTNPARAAWVESLAIVEKLPDVLEAQERRCWCSRCEEKRFAALAERAHALAKRSPRSISFKAFEAAVEKLADAIRDEIAPRTSLGISSDLGSALAVLASVDVDGCAEAADVLDRLAQDERESQELNAESPDPCTAGGRDADPA